jgi:hypothetical protein
MVRSMGLVLREVGVGVSLGREEGGSVRAGAMMEVFFEKAVVVVRKFTQRRRGHSAEAMKMKNRTENAASA